MSVGQLVAIDGRDALAFVIVRPGDDTEHVSIEAGARGISKSTAAYILRRIADQWDAEDDDQAVTDATP